MCKRRKLADQSLLYNETSAANLRWFILPSEAMPIVDPSGGGGGTSNTLKSPKPFTPKVYKERETRETNYLEGSVPSQIMQSSWYDEQINLNSLPHATIDLDSAELGDGTTSVNNHYLPSSVDYEDSEENELLVSAAYLGTTVTGPSICFAMGESKTVYESDVKIRRTATNRAAAPEMESHATQTPSSSLCATLTQTAEDANCSIPQSQQMISSIPINGQVVAGSEINNYYNTTPNTAPLSYNSIGQPDPTVFSFPHNNQGTITTSPLMINNNHLMYGDGINNYHVNSNTSYSPIPPTSMTPLPYDAPQQQFVNMNGNVVDSTIYHQSPIVVGSPIPPSSLPVPCNSPCFQNFQSQHSLDSQYNSAPECFSNNNISSPAMSASPIPYQTCTDSLGVYTPVMSPQQNYGSNNGTPLFSPTVGSIIPMKPLSATPPSSEPSVSEQIVQNAMRRVTDQIASELKSEIRGLVSQVEQGIENGLRERANSFTFKDRKIESLKRRTRTLSGQSISNALDKQHDLEVKKKVDVEEKVVNSDSGVEEEGKSDKKSSSSCVTCNPTAHAASEEKMVKSMVEGSKSSKWHCPPKNVFKPALEVKL